MKKIIILIVILIVLSISSYTLIELKNNKIDKEVKVIKNVVKEEVVIPKYVDDNPIVINFYKNLTNEKSIIKEFTAPWNMYTDMLVLSVLLTDIPSMPLGNYFQYDWKTYYNNYTNIEGYKVGYYVKFSMTNGEVIDKLMLTPDDTYSIYDYISPFLYDDVNIAPGAWHSHINQEDMTDSTLFTSIKIFSSSLIADIVSPMELTAFTYNGPEDFDPETGLYRGKSSSTIKIYRQ